MKAILQGIQAIFELQTTKDLFTNQSLTPPNRVIMYHREYQSDNTDHIPPRPYLSVEFGQTDWEAMDGHKEGDQLVKVHVVQDTISYEEKQDNLLLYDELVVQSLNQVSILGDVLVHENSSPDQSLEHYHVSVESFQIVITRDLNAVPTLYIGSYEIWLGQGNVGTYDDFLAAITGPQGPQGATGPQGPQGETGAQGPQGETGPQGATGPTGVQGPEGDSAYQVWLDAGNTGTAQDFLDSLEGAQGPAGATGPQGPQGDSGNDGADGKTVLNGTGAPGAGLGSDGDFYIDTAADTIYGPKTGGAWGSGTSLIGPQGPQGDPGNDGADGATGPQGPAGNDGADGKTVLNGTGAPGAGLGSDGDFYIDTAADTIYGPKTGGAWGSGTSLIGPQGLQGDPGNDGADGATGPQGPAGNDGADGKTVLNGTGAPGAGLGSDGDFYIDTAADTIYGPKTGGAWGSGTSLIGPQGPQGDPGNDGADGATGPQGPAGNDGADGKTVLNGTGAPGAGLGTNGDFYIDTAADTIYGPKTGGAWGSGTSLIGPQGPEGPQGPAGTESEMKVARLRSSVGQNADSTNDIAVEWNNQSLIDTDVYSHNIAADNSRVTVLNTGKYLISGVINYAGTTANYRFTARVSIRINGTTIIDEYFDASYIRVNSGSDNSGVSFAIVLSLSANDYFEILSKRISNTSGDASITDGTNLSTIRLRGSKGEQGPQGDPGNDGADGATGPQGPAGNDGADGKTVLNGTGAPGAGLGSDGDFYIDTAADTIYGPKTGGAWGSGTSLIGPQGLQGDPGNDGADGATGPQGPAGNDGADGKTVLNGTGAPGAGLGSDGDFYIDTAADTIYGPKTGGAWGSGTSLIGPQGPQGDPGNDGADGATGPQGPAGNDGADGKTVLNGTGAPGAGLGGDGDFYIDTAADTMYGPKTGGAWGSDTSLIGPQGPQGDPGSDGADGATGSQGPAGNDGADGADGKTVLNGTGAPGAGLGADGDFYIDTAADTIYGPKTGGAWGSGTSLIGPQGPAGPAGSGGNYLIKTIDTFRTDVIPVVDADFEWQVEANGIYEFEMRLLIETFGSSKFLFTFRKSSSVDNFGFIWNKHDNDWDKDERFSSNNMYVSSGHEAISGSGRYVIHIKGHLHNNGTADDVEFFWSSNGSFGAEIQKGSFLKYAKIN